MNIAAPTMLWLAAGLPVAAPYFLRRRWDIGLYLLPFGGCLALVVPWLVSAFAGTSVGGWSWAIQAAVAGAAMGAVVELALRLGGPRPPSLAKTGERSPFHWLKHVLTAAGVLAVAIVAWRNFATGLAFCRGCPPYQWDGYAIWLFKAKLLAIASAYPNDVRIGGGHLDYPLALPALFAWFKRFGGMELLELSSATGVVAALFPLAAWAGMFRRMGGCLAGVVALAPFALDRLLMLQFAAFADPLLTMAGVYGLTMCVIGVRDRDVGYMLAGGLALAVAVATKNEGAMWVLCCGVTIGLYALETGGGVRKAVGGVVYGTVPAMIFFVAWTVAWKRIGVNNDLAAGWSTSLVSARIEPLLMAIRGELGRTANWLLWGAGLAGMLVLPVAVKAANIILAGSPAVRGRAMSQLVRAGLLGLRRAAVLLSGPAMYVVGMALIYLTTPHPLEWHLRTSLSRVIYLVPPAVLALMLVARVGAPARPESEPASAGGDEGQKRSADGQL